MPTVPLTFCRQPGCTAKVPRGYCQEHQPIRDTARYDRTTRRNTPELLAASRLRSSPQWQRLRAWARANHPLCCDPLNLHPERPAITDDIHHIQGLVSAPTLALTPLNLAPLCRPCHAAIEARERQGIATAGLFAGKTCEPKP